MEKQFQVMGAVGNTYGVYPARTPEGALDKWAEANGWGTWARPQNGCPDLFPGFKVNGDKVILT